MSANTWSCEKVLERLPAILDEPGTAPVSLMGHVESCLSCQAELVRGRKMLRLLRGLRSDELPLPRGMLSDLFVAVENAGHRRAIRSILTGRRVAYLSGLGIGLLSTGAIMLVARTHANRRIRPHEGHIGPPIA